MFFGFNDITISYRKEPVVQHVSMAFTKGRITAILGLNGSGKSSLLRTIVRSVRPKSGAVILEDKDILTYPKSEVAKKVAYLSQIHSCPQDIDVRTLVSYGRFPHQRFGHGLTDEDYKIIDDAIAVTGLENLKDRAMGTLSGGESQRAWLAMAIAQQPEILVLDEPTTYLDASYQIEILAILKRLNRERGLTIVMVLHDLNLAARYADELFVLGQQKVLAHGTPKQIITEENLKQMFHVDAQVLTDESADCPFYIPKGTETP